jgi:dihydroorotase
MGELTDAGCIAFSHADAPLADTQVLLRAMQYAATFGYHIWLRPQDAHLSRGGVAHDGEIAMRLGLPAIPACAETIALGTIFALARVTGSRVHLARLSTREGVESVREAKREGLNVTCDVGINHLHLCDADIGWFDAQCRLVPPLRGVEDRQALRAGLADGTIDLVCSDHTPVDDDGKQLPFAEAEPGATGLELMLPLMLKWAREDSVPLATALARVTADAARILGVDAGHLAVGAPADVCIFDPERRWMVEPAALKSQGKNTPFLGLELVGRVGYTLVNGQIVHELPRTAA